ncbi:hypothetical protein [Rhizobacter sp. Root404]|uniref:hypothetical protein n=1 Tax=Rhizobacter sp. Root404 TaxID=1736528 RepID=UPI0012F7F11B|nr:hypothetical protein [Rhizobacter sp. Root404]
MHPNNRIKIFAKPRPITKHFALMTDLTRILPAAPDHPHSRLPGILLGLDTNLPIRTPQDQQFGILLNGDSSTPTALFVITVGHHVFMQLLNPLDAALRSAMKQHHDAECLPQLVVAKDGLLCLSLPKVPFWHTALADTEGRARVDAVEWLAGAEQLVDALPACLEDSVPLLRACKWYHAFFVVPDDESHPLYSRVT